MIYTCTTNPSLDYYMTFENIDLGKNNRSEMEIYEAGGKGVNVSIVLNNFQIKNSCLGFLGGYTKDKFLSYICKYPNIQPLFTTINEDTRINVKLMDSNNETSLNAKGPHITKEEFEKFKNRLTKIYKGDYFVISGNIQDEIKDDIIDTIHCLAKDEVSIVLDVDPDVVDRCLDCGIYMVKINDSYLDYSKKNLDEIGELFLSKGVNRVLYSNANKDSYLFTKDKTLKCKNIKDNLINSTGSSDSMVAGLLYGALRGASLIECFKYANAASMATSLSNDLGSKDKIEELFDTIEVEEL